MSEPEFLISQKGSARRFTLNRPKALNALTSGIVAEMSKALKEWEEDPSVSLIVLDAVGDKAFCAGGDVARLYTEGRAGNTDYCTTFWKENYALDAQIAELKTPFVALMDGIVMGGGVGISAHGTNRVVTERTVFAFPECGIGLIPDVGASYLFASVAPGLAAYVTLTGLRLNGADCLELDLADVFVPSDRLAELTEALMTAGDTGPLETFKESAEQSKLPALSVEIERVFEAQDLASITNALNQSSAEWAGKAKAAIDRGSPTSLALTLALLSAARSDRDLRRCLDRELKAAAYCLVEGDFLEGVRAAIIDKDRSPAWKASTAQPGDFAALLN